MDSSATPAATPATAPTAVPAAVPAAFPARQRTWALLVTAVLAVLAAGTVLALRPAAAGDESAPPGEFSSARAVEHIDQLASEPHPTGSPANDRVIRYLLAELRTLGLSPRVDTQAVARSFPSRSHLAGTVSNVRATLQGADSTGTVLLVAHHDSVPTGPGANDDAVGVSVILEAVRALRAGPAPRNDVEILFTDGEEAGLLGAHGFVESGAITDPERTVVLNVEARGASGPAIMFETAGDTAGLMAPLRAASVVSTSVSDEVYRMLPNDTDLTMFATAGVRGLNFAYVGSSPAYHTPYDDPGHVSQATVQDLGSAVFAATGHLAQADLAELAATGSGDTTYFALLGLVVHYPSWLVLPLALVAVLGYGAALAYTRRRGLRLRQVSTAAATFALALLGAAAPGVGLWYLLTAVRPEYRLFISGDTHRPGYYAAALLCLTAGVLLGWYRWMRRRRTAAEISAAVVGWFAVLGLVMAVLMGGGSYLFVWPALAGAAGLAFAGWRSANDWQSRSVTGAAAAVPATVLILPIVVLLFPTMGIAVGAAPVVLAVLLGATALVLVEALAGVGRAFTVLTLAVALAAPLLVGAGLLADRYDAQHPRPVSLGYGVDFDQGEARWFSASTVADPAIDEVLTGEPVVLDEQFPNLPGGRYLSGPATLAESVTAPVVDQFEGTERDGVRETRLRIRAAADAHTVTVYADTSTAEIVAATVEGAALDGGVNLPASRGVWRWGLRYAGPTADGIELTVRTRGPGPLRLRVITQTAGLPAQAQPPQLPDTASWTPYPSVAGQTFAARTFEF